MVRIRRGKPAPAGWSRQGDEPLRSVELFAWTLKLLPTAVAVPAGHRLTLVITSQDSRIPQPGHTACWEYYEGGCYRPSGILPAATMGAATNTIHLGSDATALRLDIADPDLTSKPPWTLPE